ncbi:MAG: antitoxin CptB [Paracoccaceae bacterium]|jgi:antitoxin CptB
MPDKLENIRRKLRFRSLRRGTKESDMVIGGFAEAYLRELDEAQLADFEALLDENDQDVLSWVLDMKPPPAGFDTPVLKMLQNFKKKI